MANRAMISQNGRLLEYKKFYLSLASALNCKKASVKLILMNDQKKMVFFDTTGNRYRIVFIMVTFFFFFLLSFIGFIIGFIIDTPSQPTIVLPSFDHANGTPKIEQLAQQTNKVKKTDYTDWLPIRKSAPMERSVPLSVAFYVPWDEASADSLEQNIDKVDWVVPAWATITGSNHNFSVEKDSRGETLIRQAKPRIKVFPMVQNVDDGVWDGMGLNTLLQSPVERKKLLQKLEIFLASRNADGVVFDFENIPEAAHINYQKLLTEAKHRFQPHNWLISVAVPADNPDWDLSVYAKLADKLIIMAYDEHYPEGKPGPIAPQPWFSSLLFRLLQTISPEKMIIALGSYAYDWGENKPAEALSLETAWLNAYSVAAKLNFDSFSGNTSYTYQKKENLHEVWLLDAVSICNQMLASRYYGVHAFALWRMGGEDPSVWKVFDRHHSSLSCHDAINIVPAGHRVILKGQGEILQIKTEATDGTRELEVTKNGLIINQRFTQLPLPYVIERAGYHPGLVALTFDDGPDPDWTPKVLDILKENNISATFFIVGENAINEKTLLTRIVEDGHEIGNHSYTHSNMGTMGATAIKFELNATQRLFQEYTGHSMRLFRAPFFGDADPTTDDEINPIIIAQKKGYTSVGLQVDPGDWTQPGYQKIIDRTVAGIVNNEGQIVLLHDSGGDRSQTIKALPEIIHELKIRGYHFVTVSGLLNLSRNNLMPKLSTDEAKNPPHLFSLLSWLPDIIHWMFYIAVFLGGFRVVFLFFLAVRQRQKEAGLLFRLSENFTPFISVIIPAYNEELVIVNTVQYILNSKYRQFEVIVVDDGSTDNTFSVVKEQFYGNHLVNIVRVKNSGKAKALNYGLTLASGDIIIALDADTHFEPLTLSQLSRWFIDPSIGAVAGNIKVGNRVNLLARWQALEYITAQNMERRALAQLSAIMVVPGAVGAWRKTALLSLGGFPSDTLAEDQDATIAIQRSGWRVHYDQSAVAWTEAPENISAFFKQRSRWIFGTLQCLWKHRTLIAEQTPKGLARYGFPQAVIFQFILSLIAPVIDFLCLFELTSIIYSYFSYGEFLLSNSFTPLLWGGLFITIDLLIGAISFYFEKNEDWCLLLLLIPQRIGYRQMMYFVVMKSLFKALCGYVSGWNKIERSGRIIH